MLNSSTYILSFPRVNVLPNSRLFEFNNKKFNECKLTPISFNYLLIKKFSITSASISVLIKQSIASDG